MENCQHGNFAPVDKLVVLPVSQAGIERHKCVICAYQGGFQVGIQRMFTTDIPVFQIHCKHGKTAPEYLLRELSESQAGAGRHKCAICAFHDGLEAGIRGNDSVLADDKKKATVLAKGIQQVEIPNPNPGSPLKLPRKFSARKNIDYLKIHAERTSLGYLGELLVYDYERESLIGNSLGDLASRIQHTSVLEGDGAGFDILSFTLTGENKYIEVKTTAGHIDTPFYMSAHEVEFSKQNSTNYYLYREFDLNEKERQGKFYLFRGDISSEFHFNPVVYQVAR
jgi:hypothetical protein